jgi:hypothetical protein
VSGKAKRGKGVMKIHVETMRFSIIGCASFDFIEPYGQDQGRMN